MAANLALAGTAIGLSHLLGLLLLLYSLEKVSGVVSRTLKRVTGGKLGRANARDAEAPGASPSPELASSPSKTGHGSGLRAKGWVRGCACPVRGMCEGGLGSEGAGGGGGAGIGRARGGERDGGASGWWWWGSRMPRAPGAAAPAPATTPPHHKPVPWAWPSLSGRGKGAAAGARRQGGGAAPAVRFNRQWPAPVHPPPLFSCPPHTGARRTAGLAAFPPAPAPKRKPGQPATKRDEKRGARARPRAAPPGARRGGRQAPLRVACPRARGPPASRALARPSRSPPTSLPSPLPLTSQEGCVCANRWVPASRAAAAALASGGAAPFRLAVPCPADLAWHDVTCVVTDAQTLLQKQVLHPCSGIAVPGETMALMGPSGAGKSTLLDLLAGRKAVGRLGGTVLMNGRPCGTLFKRISAYVAQEDVFVPTMTATETLVFHATLTLPSAVDGAERGARIADVLRLMGLWRARHTQVGGALPGGILVRGLSGGEKRRLNIGCALIASPSLLFLDEPTTGLDSFAALNVMEHMRDLAGMGHTVIASIHQPRAAIWEMFHKVTVLSEGYQLYFGRPEDARAWFGDALGYDYDLGRDGAVSDWMMDLVSVGFAKPPDYAGRSMACVADVVAAYRAFQRERPPVTDAVLRTVSTLPAAGMKSLAAHTAVSVSAAVAAARASSAAGSAVSGVASLTGGAFPARASTADGYGAATRVSSTAGGGVAGIAPAPVDLRVTAGAGGGGGPIDRLRSEALAEVAAKSPKAVTDRLQWASGRYAASWWTQFRTLFKRAVLAQLRNPTDATSRLLLATWVGMLGGLVFFNLPVGPEAVQKRLAVLFFTLLLFELVPFCYMSFYVEDRRFFAADVASDLYHPR